MVTLLKYAAGPAGQRAALICTQKCSCVCYQNQPHKCTPWRLPNYSSHSVTTGLTRPFGPDRTLSMVLESGLGLLFQHKHHIPGDFSKKAPCGADGRLPAAQRALGLVWWRRPEQHPASCSEHLPTQVPTGASRYKRDYSHPEGGGRNSHSLVLMPSHLCTSQFFYQFGKCVSASDTVLPKALQKASPGSFGHQSRKDRNAGRVYTEF